MKMTFKVTYVDEDPPREHLVLATLTDFVALENEFNISAVDALQDRPITYMPWLVWRSLHRTGRTPDGFEAWLDSVDMLEPVTPEGEEPVVEEIVGEAEAG
jgi:hypothetical protein